MAGKQQQHQLDNFPDASGKVVLGMTDNKCDFYESSTPDSGFISSGNLIISGEIVSEEIKSEFSEHLSDFDNQEDNCTKSTSVPQLESYMRLDSGVDLGLSESFSSLSLKNPGLNDLSSGKLKHPVNPIFTKTQQEKHATWEVYYAQDEDGDTQLHTAIIQGFLEVVLALIRETPHPRLLDTPNDDAQSPLHLAVATGQWKIVRWLIVAGARPSPRNLQGDSPLHICARTGDIQSCKAIVEPITQMEVKELALCYSRQPYQPFDLDQWNYDGQTSVHVAVIQGHIDLLRYLVWYGADINAREGTKGYTALHYAFERSDDNLIKFLLKECKTLNPSVLTYGQRSVLQLGFSVQSEFADVLRSRGVPSPYTSEDEEYDEDSDDEHFHEKTNMYHSSSIIQASA